MYSAPEGAPSTTLPHHGVLTLTKHRAGNQEAYQRLCRDEKSYLWRARASVHSCCYNKNTVNCVSYKHLLLTLLEAGTSKIMVPAFSASGKTPLPQCWLSSHCNLSSQKGGGSSLGFSYKGTNPFMKAWPSRPNHLPKAPPPNIITLEYKLVEGGYKYPGYGRESPINIRL